MAPGKHWADGARCVGENPEFFVLPSDDMTQNPDYVRHAEGEAARRSLRICSACPLPVAARCLVDSLKHDERHGIRAGLLAAEREGLRKAWSRRIDPAAVSAVLSGTYKPLGKHERREVIARFAGDRSLDPEVVARGLGVPRDYLLKLARMHRKKHGMEVPSSVSSSPAG
ncbi:WhiB family transcriptional regulator [Streptomyces jumonjinensis]|nr:WhiB family transcriptional regulator [Streptomyces jumonjinensis]